MTISLDLLRIGWPYRINTKHPLARGLVFAAVPVGTSWVELVGGQVTKNASDTATVRAGVDGNNRPAMQGVGAASTNAVAFANKTGLDDLVGPCTLFAECSLNLNVGRAYIFHSRERIITGNGVGLDLDDRDTVENAVLVYVNSNNTRSFGALGTDSEQFTHRVMFSVDGTNSRIYAKGALAETFATADMPAAHANRRTTMLARDDSVTSDRQGSASICLAWNRVLSLDEYRLLHLDPWVLVEAPRSIWVPVISGIPVLSSPSVTSITGTSAVFNVTIAV